MTKKEWIRFVVCCLVGIVIGALLFHPRAYACSHLSWVGPTHNVDGTVLTDLNAYAIYQGLSSRTYDAVTWLFDPTATETDILLGSGDFYVAMTAMDAELNESAYSNEVLYTDLGQPCAPASSAPVPPVILN